MKKIAKVLVGLFVIMILLSMCSAWGDDDESSEEQTTEVVQETKKTAKKKNVKKQKATTESTKAEVEKLSTEQITKLIKSLYKGERLDSDDAEKMRASGEEAFLIPWEDMLYSKVFEDGEDWSEEKSTEFTKIVKVYSGFWGGTKKIDDLISDQKVLDQCLADRKSIDMTKYGFDIAGGTLDSGDFYVTQRLSDDSILGKLEKSLEDASSGPSSNWVAYNVVDGDMQGDDRYVIHCNEENPFPKAGVYTISYADVGDTTEVTDARGFTSTPPLYYMLSDTSTFSEDEEKITEIEEKETSARDAIVMKITGEGEDDPGKNSNESEVEEEQDSSTDGDYILEGSDSRYITEKEVENLSDADRRLAKNEIYARHGRMFDSADLQDYFESKSWYKGTVKPNDFDESVLNKYEKANIDLISSME